MRYLFYNNFGNRGLNQGGGFGSGGGLPFRGQSPETYAQNFGPMPYDQFGQDEVVETVKVGQERTRTVENTLDYSLKIDGNQMQLPLGFDALSQSGLQLIAPGETAATKGLNTATNGYFDQIPGLPVSARRGLSASEAFAASIPSKAEVDMKPQRYLESLKNKDGSSFVERLFTDTKEYIWDDFSEHPAMSIGLVVVSVMAYRMLKDTPAGTAIKYAGAFAIGAHFLRDKMGVNVTDKIGDFASALHPELGRFMRNSLDGLGFGEGDDSSVQYFKEKININSDEERFMFNALLLAHPEEVLNWYESGGPMPIPRSIEAQIGQMSGGLPDNFQELGEHEKAQVLMVVLHKTLGYVSNQTGQEPVSYIRGQFLNGNTVSQNLFSDEQKILRFMQSPTCTPDMHMQLQRELSSLHQFERAGVAAVTNGSRSSFCNFLNILHAVTDFDELKKFEGSGAEAIKQIKGVVTKIDNKASELYESGKKKGKELIFETIPTNFAKARKATMEYLTSDDTAPGQLIDFYNGPFKKWLSGAVKTGKATLDDLWASDPVMATRLGLAATGTLGAEGIAHIKDFMEEMKDKAEARAQYQEILKALRTTAGASITGFEKFVDLFDDESRGTTKVNSVAGSTLYLDLLKTHGVITGSLQKNPPTMSEQQVKDFTHWLDLMGMLKVHVKEGSAADDGDKPDRPVVIPNPQDNRPDVTPEDQSPNRPTVVPDDQDANRPSVEPDPQQPNRPSVNPDPQNVNRPTISPDAQDPNRPSVNPDPQNVNRPTISPDPQDPNRPTITPDPQNANRPSINPDPQNLNRPTVTPDPQNPGRPSVNIDPQNPHRPSLNPDPQNLNRPSSIPDPQNPNRPSVTPDSQNPSRPSIEPDNQNTIRPSVIPDPLSPVRPTVIPDNTRPERPSITPDDQNPNRPTMNPDPQNPNRPSVIPDPNNPNRISVLPDSQNLQRPTISPDPNNPNRPSVGLDPQNPNRPRVPGAVSHSPSPNPNRTQVVPTLRNGTTPNVSLDVAAMHSDSPDPNIGRSHSDSPDPNN